MSDHRKQKALYKTTSDSNCWFQLQSDLTLHVQVGGGGLKQLKRKEIYWGDCSFSEFAAKELAATSRPKEHIRDLGHRVFPSLHTKGYDAIYVGKDYHTLLQYSLGLLQPSIEAVAVKSYN